MADNANIGSQETTKTLDEQINETLAKADDKGIIPFEEGVDPVFKKLVLTEKKARAQQARAIKSHQELASLKATNQVLENTIESSTQITAEQSAELEELKFTDPDEWFNKKTQYEQEARTNSMGKVKELVNEASTKALEDLTLNERKEALEEFQSRTGVVLTDDVMENDIPPRLQKKITEMPFEDYLNEVATYLGKGKVIKQTDEVLEQTNIDKLPGGINDSKSKKASYEII